MMTNTQVLKISKTKEAIFSVVFTALAIYTPTLIHYFAGVDGGRTYLPMPFFVLLAGILLGWRAGLATAVMSPIVSYLISGMPMTNILPYVTVQVVALGAVSGFLREKYNAFLAVAASIAASWLAIGIALALFSKMSAVGYAATGLKAGLPGTLIQLLAVPAILFLLKHNFQDEEKT